MLDADTRRDIEELKRQLKYYEDQEESLLKELDTIRARKTDVKDKLKVLSNDDKYQSDMLAMVYQQRHGKHDVSNGRRSCNDAAGKAYDEQAEAKPGEIHRRRPSLKVKRQNALSPDIGMKGKIRKPFSAVGSNSA